MTTTVQGATKWYYVVNRTYHSQYVPEIGQTVPKLHSGRHDITPDATIGYGLLGISHNNDGTHRGLYYGDHSAPETANILSLLGHSPSEVCIWPHDWSVPVTINGEATSCVYP